MDLKEFGDKMEKMNCEVCGKSFNNEDALNMHAKAKHKPKEEEKKPLFSEQQKKKAKTGLILLIIVAVFIVFYLYGKTNEKILPPTDMQGHIEASPQSHILKEPMGVAVQKHMLEHSDGSGRPGVIINYNCEDYSCETGLIEKLENFAIEYPQHVYVAPFPKMTAKIALTKQGRIEILEGYNEPLIRSFIG